MNDTELREQLVNILTGANSHMSFTDAVSEFPVKFINTKAPNVDYTFWHLVEHIRVTQKDVLDYVLQTDYTEIEWPKDYWPEKNKKATKAEWDKSVKEVEQTLKKVIKMVRDPKNDIFKMVKGTKHSFLREIGVISGHNSYHIWELAILRQVVGAWPKKRKE